MKHRTLIMGVECKVVGMGQASLDPILDEIARNYRLQDRTRVGMRKVLFELANGRSLRRAGQLAEVAPNTVYRWRDAYPEFAKAVEDLVAVNKTARMAATEARRQARAEAAPELPTFRRRDERPGLEQFRMEYFGRPTPDHQKALVKALEDPSNIYIFAFMPPGAGKDTTAGDYVAWESAPDRDGIQVAWFMESEDFSKRRLERLSRYLTDPKVYEHRPTRTPGGAVPTRSLIEDYGPFRWAPDMRHPDGSKVEKTEWSALKKYFVRVHAPEQEPNLWATGIGGATYGSRIRVCVCSDIFTLENQKSPAPRRDGYNWLDGTLDTRLDEDGRLVIIGTMLQIENNYERVLAEYTAGARVVSEEHIGGATYVKYSTGVAVIFVKAIQVDPETGEERSYWPERFPLDTVYRYKGKDYREDHLSVEEIRDLVSKGARLIRGLRWRRERSPAMFKAMYQQERDRDVGGDFTEATFERAKDESRSFRFHKAHELIVVGADPARRYGAGWVALAVDRVEGTITVVDYFWGENLGVTGIKQKLVLQPILNWNPIWFCYEMNIESAIMDDPLIKEALSESGTSYEPIFTGPSNRRTHMVSEVGSIAAYMRSGQWRVPYQTAEDRARAEILFSHFKAWDGRDLGRGGRTRAGGAGHDPDDLAMAARAAHGKCLELIEGKHASTSGLSMAVPDRVRAKFDRLSKKWSASSEERKLVKSHPAEEIIGAIIGVKADPEWME